MADDETTITFKAPGSDPVPVTLDQLEAAADGLTGKVALLDRPARNTVKWLTLPAALEPHREGFESALAAPELGAWPDPESESPPTFIDASGHAPDKVLRLMLRHVHTDLPKSLRFAVVWRDELQVRGAKAYAAIGRCGGKLAFFAELDVILEVDWEGWKSLTGAGRLALIDHELHHLAWDDEKATLRMVGHDVEEFGGILRRWGLWRPNLIQFARDGAKQLELIPDYFEAKDEPWQPEERWGPKRVDPIKATETEPGSGPTAASKRGGKRATSGPGGSKAKKPAENPFERAAAVKSDPDPKGGSR